MVLTCDYCDLAFPTDEEFLSHMKKPILNTPDTVTFRNLLEVTKLLYDKYFPKDNHGD